MCFLVYSKRLPYHCRISERSSLRKVKRKRNNRYKNTISMSLSAENFNKQRMEMLKKYCGCLTRSDRMG
ncbi:MAG: hypothetical protein AOA65_1100 [Candidatus Bathyarchaeota archaeon BA1]|nr:MAG: hypothetical protein AOA65_1100 [Candidatus Bathyarchaeota archaeon BA1]